MNHYRRVLGETSVPSPDSAALVSGVNPRFFGGSPLSGADDLKTGPIRPIFGQYVLQGHSFYCPGSTII